MFYIYFFLLIQINNETQDYTHFILNSDIYFICKQ